MKNKNSISAPRKGMSRDVHPSQLQNTEYILAVNTNTSLEDGTTLNTQLEPSNRLGINFPEGYKVIGYKTNLIKERTYYFLTNTEEVDTLNENYKRSSIGYVDNLEVLNNDFNNTYDLQNCTGCKEINNLNTPLEDIIQTPSQTYVELLHDRCISLVELEEKGLNFNINFPIKKIEINQEKLGTTLYWNDFRNNPRFLNVTNVEEKGSESYIYEVFEACEDSTFQECINIDKLRVYPKHNRIVLDPTEQQIGGNLKMGTYEFWASYCDLMGNEMTQYSTPTNPISIWDENNNIQLQTETDEFTNYSIKIKVNNLDTENFKYYKVAVVERNNVNNTQSVFLAGIYPTTDDTIIYTHSGSSNDDLYIARGNVSVKKRMDFQTLNAIKPNWEKAKGTMVSGDTLWHYGLVQKEEINLQPVFNLFGSLLHAQTAASSEDLYKSAIATSKYKFYPRNEVVPFGIRLIYHDGGYSSTFPLVARPKIEGEDELLTETDVNYKSLVDNTSCITTSRDKKWQIYNTAIAYDELCTDISENATETTDIITKTCTKQAVTTIPSGYIEIEPNEEYYRLEDSLNNDPSLIPAVESALEDTYPGENCDDPPVFYGDCTTATLVSEENIVGEVENEQTEIIIEEDIVNYTKAIPPSSTFCSVYKRNSSNNYIEDVDMTPYVDCESNGIYVRDSDFFNEDCAYSEEVRNIVNTNQFNGSSVFLNYDGASSVAGLLQTDYDVEPLTITGNFYSKLHTKAQFFKIEKNNRDTIIFEITKSSACSSLDELAAVSQVRYTIYDSCTTPNVLDGGIVDLSTGVLKMLDTTLYPSIFYVAIDSPILEVIVDLDCNPIETDNQVVYRVNPPCGCFSVYTRDLKIKNIKISYDSIRIDKIQSYESTCTFQIPRVNDCEPIPYRKYITAYWESTEQYDNNKELYDSSEINIKPEDLEDLSSTDLSEFLDYYVEGGSSAPTVDVKGNYILLNSDFRCQPIRHFKMPDNTTAPYIIDNINFQNNADSIIFPLGVELDSAVVRTAILIAYNNGLITKKQRDNIQGFEIMRGDNSISKSVIANGVAFDMYNYQKKGDIVYFPNFPFNDLGRNKYLVTERFGGTLINHPFNSDSNYMYSFISPDIFLTKPAIPSEASLQGYITGASKQEFVASDEHSEWTIVGNKGRRIAEQLAIAEVALEFIINTTSFITQGGTGNLWFVAGFTNGTNAAGAGASAGAIAIFTASQFIQGVTKVGKYRYDWLKTFRDLGRTYNFASMQVGVGNYNKILKVDQYSNNNLRKLAVRKYLKDGYSTVVDENTGEEIKINNKVRETSALLSFGEDFPIEYDSTYKTIDNNKVSSNSSNFVASEVDCTENKEFTRNIASPYFSLKNYIPDQWGILDSIKWLTTNCIFDINQDTACKPIFGGTHVISRFSWRRKVPIFKKNAIKHADKQPFMYSRYDNIAYPRFFCDYELTDGDNMWTGLGIPYPDIDSEYNFDCETGRNSMYLKLPSKIYTSVHGIVDFLVESEINCNFRYAKKEKKDWFYPQAQDLGDWLQEATLPLSEPNTFFYNNSYSFPVSNSPFKLLDKTYSKEVWAKRVQQLNAVTWSEKEVNENDLTNPWLVYKPLNWYEFKTNNGGLIDLHNIESNQFLARFENKLMLHNAIDNIAERITPENKSLGTAGMFYQRPLEFKSTDLGFSGTQNTEIVSTPYGHFWCDAKRGRVFKLDQNGQGLEIISEMIGGQPSKIKNWFREHLPFKILKYLPGVDTNNKFKGVGINMWWDDRNERLFITKKDWIPKVPSAYSVVDGIIYDLNGEVFFEESNFTNVSWTISFKPSEGSWNSYFSFYPDFSPFHNNFFQVGYNWGEDKGTIWNHLLNKSSFSVFQGKKHKPILEFIIPNENVNKILNSISLNIEGRYYLDDWDWTIDKNKSFTNMFIYNQTNNTGLLEITPQKTLSDNRKYPITENNLQKVLFTADQGKQNINYFFNRIVNQQSNISMFSTDKNNIFKIINDSAVSFRGKKVLERLRGEYFIVHLEGVEDTRYNIILKSMINNETTY